MRMPNVYTPMGITAENVARKFGIGREEQDAFALRSHQRAAAAIAAGQVQGRDRPAASVRTMDNGAWREFAFDTDEGPRADTIARGAGHAQAGVRPERHGDRRQLVAAQRRRRAPSS